MNYFYHLARGGLPKKTGSNDMSELVRHVTFFIVDIYCLKLSESTKSNAGILVEKDPVKR